MSSQDAQENTPPASPETTQADSAPDAAAPALNREQRRAQAKGKKGAAPGFHPVQNNAMRGGGRPANAPIQNKIPRTGHK